MNRIIQEYLNTSVSFDSILEKFYDKNQYLETVFLDLRKEINEKEMNQELLQSIDKAIINGHPDINLFLLFIGFSILYTTRFNQLEKAQSLYSIASTFSPEEIHPITKAHFSQHLCNLYRLQGKNDEADILMLDSVTSVNKTDPRYFNLWSNYLLMYATSGKLMEFGECKTSQLKECTRQDQVLKTIEIKIVNAVITGSYLDGTLLFKEYEKNLQTGLPYHMKVLGNLLKIIAGDFDENHYQEVIFKYLANVFKNFSYGRIDEAMKHYQELIKSDSPHPYLSWNVSPISYHFELCLGKKGMSRLLLLEQAKNGGRHYLDDLFCGRVQLLENDFEGADFSFSRLTENTNRFGAKNRLVFELQFAKEMKLPDILRLINGWKSESRVIVSKLKAQKPQLQIVLEKGTKLLVGNSLAIKQVKDLVKKYATLNAPVLVTGETGTGKELVSRAIHDEGPNPNEPFLAINCGALTDTLLQSELFGYEAGAFTGAQKQRKGIFEAAGKGTVFLDEFGEISPILQVSLLRVLEANEIRMIGSATTRKIKCKIVVATNVDLHKAVIDKKIREDLFFRLARFEIKIPSLRDRVEDLPDLIHHFLLVNSNEFGKKKLLSNELLQALTTYHWPGNIRELKNEIERLYILNPDKELLGREHFDFTHLQEPPIVGVNHSMIKNKVDSTKEDLIIEDDNVLKVIQKGFPIEQRHSRIKELFVKYKKFTRSQIMEIFHIGATTASKDLQFLVDSGFIIRRSPTKSTRTDYFELVV